MIANILWRSLPPLALLAASGVSAAPESAAESLAQLSLQELSNLEITSVAKTAQLQWQAPASVYVITHEEIARSGATSIAEVLRLAPNLHVSQYSANTYIAGARGFAGAEEAQNFSNKLLVLIDGRSVYTPLYSGVYLDVQDTLLEDVERIEVISGPGATLWGANAMNGVINVITKPTHVTTGSFAKVGVGNQERGVGARVGDQVGGAWSYRVYGKAFERDEMELENGSGARDEWDNAQLGFRSDWAGERNSFTVQGDVYAGDLSTRGPGSGELKGSNLLGRWQRRSGEREWQIQGYYDRTSRAAPPGGVAFSLDTFDLELQQRIRSGAHQLIWGLGARYHDYAITNSAALLFEPNEGGLLLANAFIQDSVSLTSSVELTVGIKAERDPFSGWNPLPDLRIAWRPRELSLVWIGASRAIRSPTPFDRNVIERIGDVTFLTGDRGFEPELVDAYEIGYRSQPTSRLSLSISAFYNVYDDLRTVEPASSSEFVPLHWDNLMHGDTYGVEVWAKWQVADWWRLSPGVRVLEKNLRFSRGASGLLSVAQSGNDPRFQALLTSSMDLGKDLTFQVDLRYVDELPEPRLDAYHELNAALIWHRWERLDVAVSGTNLLDRRHLEYPAPNGEYIRRSVIAQARWRF